MVQESAARGPLAVISGVEDLSDLPEWAIDQEKSSHALSKQRRFFGAVS